MTIGITVFGIIQRNAFAGKLSAAMGDSGGIPGGALLDPRSVLTPEHRAEIPPRMLDILISSLSSSISHTFLWAMVPAALATISILLMPGDRVTVTRKAGEQTMN
ncbi:hypothetical protein LJK88_24875 [Paenibacillus sp. P26]|nr:hypothetical protein LJK88_24875 [Paenibacillus sp. P26]UUZ95309.1 hypothetical protein LJK87_13045 [Paenibacillus sp. P25]